jgi:hypothetical protein
LGLFLSVDVIEEDVDCIQSWPVADALGGAEVEACSRGLLLRGVESAAANAVDWLVLFGVVCVV